MKTTNFVNDYSVSSLSPSLIGLLVTASSVFSKPMQKHGAVKHWARGLQEGVKTESLLLKSYNLSVAERPKSFEVY